MECIHKKELVKAGKELIEKGNRKFLDAKINNEAMGFMLFTSGTTAMSKAVMLSHKKYCIKSYGYCKSFKLR